MSRSVFIGVSALERGHLSFDQALDAEALGLPDQWRPVGNVRAVGKAELLDSSGSRTIRLRGRIAAELENECAIGMEPIRRKFDEAFDLFYYPDEAIAAEGEYALSRDDADIGFYEGDGLTLDEAVTEQLVLWLPMRPECEDAERTGVCLHRKAEPEQAEIEDDDKDDPRWSALRGLKLN